MNEHPDLDQLADVLAGDAAASAHLDGCADCRARLAELERALPRVTTALAELPLPAQPDDLDARLATALRPASVTTLPQAGRSRWLKPAAAVTGVAAAAALVFGGRAVLGGHDKQDSSSRTTAESAGGLPPTSSTGSDYGKDGRLLARELPALLSGTSPVPAAAAPAAPGSLFSDKASGAQRAPADPLARLRTTAGLASCITALTEPGQVVLPLALDYAAFEGKPALVVVLPSSKQSKVDVFVVGPACAPADAALLYFARLDRP